MIVRQGLGLRLATMLLTGAASLALCGPGLAAETKDGPAARIRLDTTDINLSADGRNTRVRHLEIEALNDAASQQLGQLPLTYDAALSTLDVLEAYTLKKDGTRLPVNPAAIFEQLAPGEAGQPMLTEFHSKTIVFPQFEAGDTAVSTVRLTTKSALLPGQFWEVYAFPTSVVRNEVRINISAPANLKLNVENHGVEYTKGGAGANAVYRWHYSSNTPHDLPGEGAPYFAVSTFDDYGALGRSWAAAAQSAMQPTAQIKALADQLTAGISDRRLQAKKLYEYVSGRVRYVAVELGRGSIIPHSAQSVVANGYGDCKDHVALLAALLKAKGIESEGVLINAGQDYALTDVATLANLDHIITYIPEFNLYLDSTAAVAPFGILPFAEYGKPVVFASAANAHRGRMPLLAPGVATSSVVAQLQLGADGKLTGKTVTTANGPFELSLREFGIAIQGIGPQTAAHNILVGLGYGDQATGNLVAAAPLVPSDSYAVTGTFEAPGWAPVLRGQAAFFMPGGLRVASVAGDGLMGPLGESKLPANASIACYSGHESEDLSLALPPGVQPYTLPAPSHIQGPNVHFDAVWSFSGNVLHVHRDFVSEVDRALCNGQIRAANAPALQAIAQSYSQRLGLTGGVATSQNGLAPITVAAEEHLPSPLSAIATAGAERLAFAETLGTAPLVSERPHALPGDAVFLALAKTGDPARQRMLPEIAPAERDAGNALRREAGRLLAEKHYSDALLAFDTLIATHGDDPSAYIGRAIAKRKLGHYAPAMRDVEHAIALGDADALKRFQDGIGGKD